MSPVLPPMSPVLLMVLSFLAVVLAIAGGYSILSDVFLRDRSRVSKRMDETWRKRQRERARKSTLFKNLGAALPEEAAEGQVRESLRQKFEAMIEQSGLDITPQRLLLLMAVAGLAVGLLVGLLSRQLLFGVLGAPVALYGWAHRAIPYHRRIHPDMTLILLDGRAQNARILWQVALR